MFYSLILTAAGFNLGVQWHKRRLEHKTEPEAHIVPWPDGQDEAFETVILQTRQNGVQSAGNGPRSDFRVNHG